MVEEFGMRDSKHVAPFPSSHLICIYILNPVIPTTSWDSLWYGIAEWFGIDDPADLSEILPNKRSFPLEDMFTMDALYETELQPPPTSASNAFKSQSSKLFLVIIFLTGITNQI